MHSYFASRQAQEVIFQVFLFHCQAGGRGAGVHQDGSYFIWRLYSARLD
jgi:hypothetical protein